MSFTKVFICENCNREAEIIQCDFGIGPYEYHGAKCNHKDIQPATACCQAEAFEGRSKIIRNSLHVANKNHNSSIKKGDKYQLTVTRFWRNNGPSWIVSDKKKV